MTTKLSTLPNDLMDDVMSFQLKEYDTYFLRYNFPDDLRTRYNKYLDSGIYDINSSIFEEFLVTDKSYDYIHEQIVIDDFFRKYKHKLFDRDSFASGSAVIKRDERKYSTSSNDINRRSRDFFNALKKITSSFVDALKLQEFEDGMGNDLTRQVEGFIKENDFVTYSWLGYIYSNNQNDPRVLSSLLRIICIVIGEEVEDCLLPIVIAGLSHPSSDTQEAAIMVIENWRTKNCYDALNNAKSSFNSVWIRNYGLAVLNELKEELGIC